MREEQGDVLIGEVELGDQAWSDVLQAMDRTYAELVEYQEQLEARNAELTNLRHFLASIMGSISDYLIVTDRDGGIADASVSFREAVGSGIAGLKHRKICEFFEGEDCAHVTDALRRTLSTRQEARISATLVKEAGRDPLEIRISPLLDRRGKSTGAVLTGRSMGELLAAYAELEASHEQLKDAQGHLVRSEKMASLGRLLAGVAHELNNPISFVYANAHTLDKYLNCFETYFDRVQTGASRAELMALREELRLDRNLKNLRTAVQGARDGAERVRDIVEDLRRLSADGSGEKVVFDLAETARLSANWVERGMEVPVGLVFSGDQPCLAFGRPGHVQQVLMNLVQNAVDAMAGMEAPEVCFDFRYEKEEAVLELSDIGPGIPPELSQTIFDPFFTTKEVGKGTGLGLSLSLKIVEEHGGRLELQRRDGTGACFRMSLPRGDRR